ncbi:MAG: hypothetical protein QW374_04925 [Candidatus Bathyarchaeia archaeon]
MNLDEIVLASNVVDRCVKRRRGIEITIQRVGYELRRYIKG